VISPSLELEHNNSSARDAVYMINPRPKNPKVGFSERVDQVFDISRLEGTQFSTLYSSAVSPVL
jgi:hypothetical protein